MANNSELLVKTTKIAVENQLVNDIYDEAFRTADFDSFKRWLEDLRKKKNNEKVC